MKLANLAREISTLILVRPAQSACYVKTLYYFMS